MGCSWSGVFDVTKVSLLSGITECGPAGAASTDNGSLELASAVDAIRAQLSNAMVRAEGQRLQFELADVELELEVAITRESSVDGGVRVWVISAGASGALTASATHRVKVTLRPKDMNSGQAPVISEQLGSIPPR